MGHYTEFEFACSLKRDTPQEIIDLLYNCIHGDQLEKQLGIEPEPDQTGFLYSIGEQGALPIDHPFGQCPRWPQLLRGSFSKESLRLRIKADLKNYDDEIALFCDWIGPFIAGRKQKKYLGFWKAESMNHRFNVYKIGERIEV